MTEPHAQALGEGDHRFRRMADSAPVLIWVSGPDGKCIWFNKPWLEYVGRSMAEELGDGWVENVHPEDREQCIRTYVAAFDARREFSMEYRLRRCDGEYRWLLDHGIPQYGETGVFEGYVGSCVDISGVKETEQALRESQARLAAVNEELRGRLEESQTLLNLLPVGVFVAHDPSCERITSNRAGAGMLALPEGINTSKTSPESESLGFRVFQNGVEVPDHDLPMQRSARSGLPVEGEEFEIQRPDGSVITLLEHAAPLFDRDQNVRGCLGTFVDITRVKRTEQALEESRKESDRQRRLYEAILANTPDLAYVFDRQHRFIYANEGLLRIWGRTWDEAIGRTCLELGYEPWHAEMHDREIDHVVATKQPIRGEVPFSGTIGTRMYDYIMVPVVDARGEVEAVAGTTRDVTERKFAEQEKEQLLRSERMARAHAERADRLKDEFLATLSHELRTPLNAVVGWATILAKPSVEPELLKQGVEVIARNARAQALLVSDLLDMSRIISGKMRLEVERVELPLVIESAVDAIRPAADAKEIRLQCILEPIAEAVHGDPARLQQVVWNLVSNAVKFTPRGGRVQVVLARVQSHVELSVSDTGCGIKPGLLPYLFERFRQGDSSTTREHGGLGLGLAIAKQLVELHGGSIAVASDGPGRGSTFTIQLPFAVLQASERRAPREVSPQESPPGDPHPRPDLAGLRVLVVDDDSDARELVRRVLEGAAVQVSLASGARAALLLMEQHPVDIILSDIGMPEIDGYSFIRAVRARGISTPAVALTALVRSEDRTRALYAGFQTHLAKPVEPGELLATMSALAPRRGQWRRGDLE